MPSLRLELQIAFQSSLQTDQGCERQRRANPDVIIRRILKCSKIRTARSDILDHSRIFDIIDP